VNDDLTFLNLFDVLFLQYDEAMVKLARKAALPSIDALFESTQYIRESASSQGLLLSSLSFVVMVS
jgi:hypothetical protein